ncbi:MAG: hypothetical protein ACI32H_02245 [Bacilli bacterium]
MKKDRKFLIALELNLSKLSKKNRDKIVSKYYDIIEEEKSKKRKITSILKDLGKPEEVAKREIENLKNNNRLKDKINNVINTLKNQFKNKSKKVKKEKVKKESLISKIKNKIKRKDTLKNNIEDVIEESKEEIINVSEIVTEKNIFESRSTRVKRIIYKTLGVILTIILLFIWLWLVIVFMASIFALLDGVKLYGINIALLGIVLLVLTIVILINKSIFRKKISLKWSLIFIISFIVIIAFGITLSLKEISEIKTTHDVSDKYTMTRSFTTYKMPSNNKPLYITFNSNYKTKYIVEYDESMKGKIGVEVKYYECYYDYFIKKGSDNIYISLKLNKRDRLSVYIDDLKEGKIYDNDELERYTVKITGSKNDIEKVIIN